VFVTGSEPMIEAAGQQDVVAAAAEIIATSVVAAAAHKLNTLQAFPTVKERQSISLILII